MVRYNRRVKLKTCTKLLKENVLSVIGVSLIIGLLGAFVSTILPNQHTAKGLLVITRKADEPSKDVFTYEGSYAQQNVSSYETTFLSILQSPANLKSTGTELDLDNLMRNIKAR